MARTRYICSDSRDSSQRTTPVASERSNRMASPARPWRKLRGPWRIEGRERGSTPGEDGAFIAGSRENQPRVEREVIRKQVTRQGYYTHYGRGQEGRN